MMKRRYCLLLLFKWTIWKEGIFASTPAVIGKDGIKDVFELQLTNEGPKLYLKASCAVIREHVAKG